MTDSMAAASTRLLRESDEPLFARLRALLQDRGVDVRTAALAVFFPDDTNMEYGIVVTDAGDVFEFELHYGAGDLSRQVRTATLAVWTDLTDRWQAKPWCADIEEASRLAAAGSSR